MLDNRYTELRKQIRPVDRTAMEEAEAHWMTVAKPLFSLGKLETAVIRMAGMKRTSRYSLKKKGLLIFCADNGVVQEGVTQTGQEVTAIVADNFTKGKACTGIMAEIAGVDVFPVDIGMVSDVPSVTKAEWKVAYGTRDFYREPAMEREQVWRAIQIGMELVRQKQKEGYEILATGEMGIGNTTTSSAVAAVLLDCPAEAVTGKGAGLSSEGLKRKIQVIREAISLHKPDRQDVADVLSKVGGLDLAGLTGAFLGGAVYGMPIVIDGFISSAAALCAARIAPEAVDYMIASHVSKEPAGKEILDELGLSPCLDCDMCLGEGSGAVALMPLLDMGLRVYEKMSSFEEIEIEEYKVLK